jgi:hypothetical protein
VAALKRFTAEDAEDAEDAEIAKGKDEKRSNEGAVSAGKTVDSRRAV